MSETPGTHGLDADRLLAADLLLAELLAERPAADAPVVSLAAARARKRADRLAAGGDQPVERRAAGQ